MPTEKELNNRKRIGKEIEDTRIKKGLSQIALAQLLDVEQSTISKIERGAFSVSIDYLFKIGQHLGFKIELKDIDV